MRAGKTIINATAVIGAGYGDEGKGLLTDAFAAPFGRDGLVIRSNGGAQAGHTVELEDGRRRVFHHVGSGTLGGAATFLSRFFIANPIILREELGSLSELGVHPRLMIDPEAPVTLPYDMMINQIVERSRGGARHGSCGLGIGETVERSLRSAFRVSAADLVDEPLLRVILGRVRTEWVPVRLQQLGVAASPDELALVASEAVEEHWLQDVVSFVEAMALGRPKLIGKGIVFEGAQGLLLDQDRGHFPYVTRSNTGVKNMAALAVELGIDHLDLVYATRAYTTRHGAGPLPYAYTGKPYPGIVDRTNIPNPWQGTLRFAPLDLDVLAESIKADRGDLKGVPLTHTLGLAVTCLDQTGTSVEYRSEGGTLQAGPEALAWQAAGAVNAATLYAGRGPTRATLERLQRSGGQAKGRREALPRRKAETLASRAGLRHKAILPPPAVQWPAAARKRV
ncbi:MAG: adenylosuccinate synthetase [Hyphomicrobiaceae bacterium]